MGHPAENAASKTHIGCLHRIQPHHTAIPAALQSAAIRVHTPPRVSPGAVPVVSSISGITL
jgi:hypothetical protein